MFRSEVAEHPNGMSYISVVLLYLDGLFSWFRSGDSDMGSLRGTPAMGRRREPPAESVLQSQLVVEAENPT